MSPEIELVLLADATRAAWGSERSYNRSIRAAALSRVGNRDVRSAHLRERDGKISAFRSGWISLIGKADGELATACAWPGTEGARVV